MSRWQEFLRSQGARFDGFELLDFGDPQAGQGASTLLTDLSHEGVIQVSGVESEKFLQGQLTCDLREVDSHHARLGALCTYQGRAVATFILNRIGSDYHLQLDRSALPQLLATLGKYIVFSKATLRDASDEWVRIGLAGHHASELLGANFGALPAADYEVMPLSAGAILRLPGSVARFQIWLPFDAALDIWPRLKQGATLVGSDGWRLLEIRAGVPMVTAATQEAFIPQMLNFDELGGINYRKGCYTGQEIIARSHYRGKQKRHTQRAVVADAVERIAPGSEIHAAGEAAPVGTVVTAARAGAGWELLAVLKDDRLDAELRWGDSNGPPVRLLDLPYTLSL